MRVVIPDWIVVDEEIVVPRSGVILAGLGVRLRRHEGAIEVPKTVQTVTGSASWTRRDDANQLVEMVLDTGTWSVLVESSWAWRTERVTLGSTYSAAGRLIGIAEYEFEDFALPDVRTDWKVECAAQDEETLEWHVDVAHAG